FKAPKRYRHKNSIDIDIDVTKVLEDSPTSIKLVVWYWNRQYKFRHDIDEIVVKKEHYDMWDEIDEII
ncbi:MAG: hypothetical protein EB127_24890, partial [Alphaproteobacteria bacterium]|nr:hypothetical protein [Alphaproteobacteria bacterium]